MTNKPFAKYTTMSTVYSGRAECERDCNELTFALQSLPISSKLGSTFIRQLGFGECSIQIEFREPVMHSDLLVIVSGIDDCHVLLQTLEPLDHKQNPMEREYLRK